jgi:hypothetical protein
MFLETPLLHKVEGWLLFFESDGEYSEIPFSAVTVLHYIRLHSVIFLWFWFLVTYWGWEETEFYYSTTYLTHTVIVRFHWNTESGNN